MRQLRQQWRVKTFLEPPRFAVSAGDAPSVGSADVGVTLVVFSDFQCPFCRAIAPVLRRLEREFQPHVRLVFKNFPLPGHAAAPKAAEAALCAGEQQRFWEMHDLLFENQSRLDAPDLANYARIIGMDVSSFEKCLAHGTYAAAVRRDLNDGGSYGVSATPTMFLNGRLLIGAMPFESLSAEVVEELSRLGITSTVRAKEPK